MNWDHPNTVAIVHIVERGEMLSAGAPSCTVEIKCSVSNPVKDHTTEKLIELTIQNFKHTCRKKPEDLINVKLKSDCPYQLSPYRAYVNSHKT